MQANMINMGIDYHARRHTGYGYHHANIFSLR